MFGLTIIKKSKLDDLQRTVKALRQDNNELEFKLSKFARKRNHDGRFIKTVKQ